MERRGSLGAGEMKLGFQPKAHRRKFWEIIKTKKHPSGSLGVFEMAIWLKPLGSGGGEGLVPVPPGEIHPNGP